MKQSLLLSVCLLLLFSFNVNAQSHADSLFDYTVMHEIRFEFEEDDYWETLKENYESQMGWKKQDQPIMKSKEELLDHFMAMENSMPKNDIEYLECDVTIDGNAITSVGLRLKGYSSYFASNEYKKSLKLDFNAFVDTLKYDGLKKLNLNNGLGDPSMQRDFISYYMMRESGIAAPRVSYAKIYLNDRYWGVYALVEQIDKTFLEQNFASGKGNLFKNIGWTELEYISPNFDSYSESIELKTNEETADGKDYVNFVKSINQLNGNAFADSIQKLFYTDYYFKTLAIDVISKNWDSYMQHGRNFYLYHEPVSDLFYWIPWDYNLAWDGNLGMQETNDSSNFYTFTYDTLDNHNAAFLLKVKQDGLNYLTIEYGDGTSKEYYDFNEDSLLIIAETHDYQKEGIFTFNLWSSYENEYVNASEKIILMDTSNLECPTALFMSNPYYPNDENIIRTHNEDAFCCNCQWDKLCQNRLEKEPNSSTDDAWYPIRYNSGKTLITKLFNNPALFNRYKDVFRYILDSVYIEDSIIGLIDQNTNLIREAVYADTNYLFQSQDFENDISAICNEFYQTTSLKRLVAKRRQGLEKEYDDLSYNAQAIEKPINYNDIVLNEFLANTANTDETSDWIELYNNTDDIIPLKNVWISDSIAEPLMYNFGGNSAIKPHGYVMVLADEKDKKNNFHANFKLSAQGEELILSHSLHDSLDVIRFGTQIEDSSSARYPDGTGAFTTMLPTPNASNTISIPNNIITSSTTSFNIFPNPVANYININPKDNNIGYSVSLIDVLGKVHCSIKNQQGASQLELMSIPAGLYVLQINQNTETYHTPVIIEH